MRPQARVEILSEAVVHGLGGVCATPHPVRSEDHARILLARKSFALKYCDWEAATRKTSNVLD